MAAVADAEPYGYGGRVLKALSMFTRSMLVRGAIIGLLLAGLAALADGGARLQLAQAVKASRNDGDRVIAHIAGAVN